MTVMKALSILLACGICIASAQPVGNNDRDISRAVDLLLKGDAAQAKSLLLAITANFPADPRGWSLLGRILVKEAKYSEAEKAPERSLDLRPGDVTTLTELANARVGLGKFDAAKRGFEQA